MTTDTTPTSSFKYTRPPLYKKQEDAIFNDARYSVCEASTKSGKTHGCIAWIFEQGVTGKPGQNFWWVAPVFGQAKIAYRRLKRAIKTSLPDQMYHFNDSDLYIQLLPFDTFIWFKSADKPDSLYGEDVFGAVIDEASRVKEEAWHAVRSTLTATRGPIRFIGNVKGRKNWAYKLARRAEAGEEDMHYAVITAYDAADAGVLDYAEIEDAKRVLPEPIFNELYLCIPSDDGGNPFGLKQIRNCIADISTKQPAVWGWDLAKSRDYTVGIGLDREGRVCRFERWQSPWNVTKDRIAFLTGSAPALVDSTGVGDPIVEDLQALSMGGAFRNASSLTSNFQGFKFTSPSKQQLLDGLRVAIQGEHVRYPDGPIVNELESFEYEYTATGVKYSAPSGMFDDCVMALALAWRHYLAHGNKGYAYIPVTFTRSSPWRVAF